MFSFRYLKGLIYNLKKKLYLELYLELKIENYLQTKEK
jgi:hypothetical protein